MRTDRYTRVHLQLYRPTLNWENIRTQYSDCLNTCSDSQMPDTLLDTVRLIYPRCERNMKVVRQQTFDASQCNLTRMYFVRPNFSPPKLELWLPCREVSSIFEHSNLTESYARKVVLGSQNALPILYPKMKDQIQSIHKDGEIFSSVARKRRTGEEGRGHAFATLLPFDTLLLPAAVTF